MALKVHESELGSLKELGKGGMAIIFDVPEYFAADSPSVQMVFKKFRRRIRPVPVFGLEMLIKVRDALHPDQCKAIDRSFNWPVRVVTDDEQGASGLILPRLDNSYFLRLRNSYGEVKVKPAEGQFLVAEPDYCDRAQIAFPSTTQRLQLCYSLVTGMGLLHRADVVYGDLSLRNFLFRLTPKPAIQFVDCDAMRPWGATSALGLQPHTPDWEPPEAQRAKKVSNSVGFAVQNKATDRYKLGLAILRIMTPGPRAAEKRDPTLAKHVMPGHLYPLLEQSILGQPQDRPTAKDWYEEFRR